METNTSQNATGTAPHYVAKAPKGSGPNAGLKRIGVAWNREDGGICLRLVGTQVVGTDVYLYPIDPTRAGGGGA